MPRTPRTPHHPATDRGFDGAAIEVRGPATGPVEFDVAVIPQAHKTEATGSHAGALRLRLQAPPLEGRANQALIEWLAHELGLPRRAIEIRHGTTSRRKRLRVDCPAEALRTWLDRVSAGRAA